LLSAPLYGGKCASTSASSTTPGYRPLLGPQAIGRRRITCNLFRPSFVANRGHDNLPSAKTCSAAIPNARPRSANKTAHQESCAHQLVERQHTRRHTCHPCVGYIRKSQTTRPLIAHPSPVARIRPSQRPLPCRCFRAAGSFFQIQRRRAALAARRQFAKTTAVRKQLQRALKTNTGAFSSWTEHSLNRQSCLAGNAATGSYFSFNPPHAISTTQGPPSPARQQRDLTQATNATGRRRSRPSHHGPRNANSFFSHGIRSARASNQFRERVAAADSSNNPTAARIVVQSD